MVLVSSLFFITGADAQSTTTNNVFLVASLCASASENLSYREGFLNDLALDVLFKAPFLPP